MISDKFVLKRIYDPFSRGSWSSWYHWTPQLIIIEQLCLRLCNIWSLLKAIIDSLLTGRPGLTRWEVLLGVTVEIPFEVGKSPNSTNRPPEQTQQTVGFMGWPSRTFRVGVRWKTTPNFLPTFFEGKQNPDLVGKVHWRTESMRRTTP